MSLQENGKRCPVGEPNSVENPGDEFDTTIRAQQCRYGRRAVPPSPPWTEERGRRDRHRASLRVERLSCQRHRDPLDPAHNRLAPAPPCAFGMTPEELRREALRLYAAGWSVEEITAVLDIAARVA